MGKLKIKLIAILLMVFVLSSAFIHEYYVSIANISVNKISNQLEIELKLDAEDFESVLSKEQGLPINFDEIDEEDIKIVSKYLSTHFEFWINGGNKKIKLIGEELSPDGDFWCYLVVDIPDVIQSIKIKNDILLPRFLQQHNIVNIKGNSKIYSHTFINKHTIHTFKIDAN
jgi:hypothetical protein